ncbi:MAG: argininosuccinate lyase [Bdellovibrio sp.]|nr:MAG: argininosuccinate lyase [Bdellovibrio sp.]
MKPLWGGRFEKATDSGFAAFSSSIDSDSRLWEVDLLSSIAHARMLGQQKILTAEDARLIIGGLCEIKDEIQSRQWAFDPRAEDIHGEIEKRLAEKIGLAALKLHTARSRNDQVATDTRLYLHRRGLALLADIKKLQAEFLEQAESHVATLLPGMTHLQHAQPVSLAHHLLAYFWMLERDRGRLQEGLARLLSLPLGSAALAGTGFPIDREQTAAELGFREIAPNSMDAVADRDFVIEFLSCASIIMMHLSRFCEELILWSTPEFGFVELGDEVTTGSSIMPQKKNPDVAELIRGRVGRVYGALMGALTMMKALPLAYNRDMQEDKIHLFEGCDTVSTCVQMMTLTLQTLRWKPERMNAALAGDFSNATDLADDLAAKGVPFREAHEAVGHLVKWCIQTDRKLEVLEVKDLRQFHPMFDSASMQRLDFRDVVNRRRSIGGTAAEAIVRQIKQAQAVLCS